MNFFVLPDTKEDILKKVCNQGFGAPLTSIDRGKKYYDTQNCSVSHSLKNISLCVQQNKDIHTGLKLLEGE